MTRRMPPLGDDEAGHRPTPQQLGEFFALMRPLSGLPHNVMGGASLLPDPDVRGRYVLRPTSISAPHLVDTAVRGDKPGSGGLCHWHTHAGGGSVHGEECWPSGDDLVHALGALATNEGQYAELIVSHGALVVVRRGPGFPRRTGRSSVIRAQHALLIALRERRTTASPVTIAALQRILIDFGLLLEVLFAPGYATLADGTASDAPLRINPEYEEKLERALAR